MQAVIAVALTVASIVLVGLVWQASSSPVGTNGRSTAPSPTSEAAAVVTPIARVETVVVSPTLARTPTPTWTPLPNCHLAYHQGTVCRWPTVTPVLPIPSCETPDTGQMCIRRGAAVVTLTGSSPTPTTVPTSTFKRSDQTLRVKDDRE